MRLIARTLAVRGSPLAELFASVRQYDGNLPLLDFSQGVPPYPPDPKVVEHIQRIVREPNGASYTDRPGIPSLRTTFAKTLSERHKANVSASSVLITAGCNQAFCAAISSIAVAGDEVMLVAPFYFNHDMWLRLERIEPVYIATEIDGIPSVEDASRRLTSRTRAVVLVSPGNPTGKTIPAEVLQRFFEFASANGIALILDETYRTFAEPGLGVHRLFENDGWQETCVFLYSFSKEFALPGYRVGAIVAHSALVHEMMKFIDCIAICAPRAGQEAVQYALESSSSWVSEKVALVHEAEQLCRSVFQSCPGGFELKTVGGFFAWIRVPASCEEIGLDLTKRLLHECGIVVLPGILFGPNFEKMFRLSFPTLNAETSVALTERLSVF